MTSITLENMKAMFEQLGITVANSVTQSLTKNQQDDTRRNNCDYSPSSVLRHCRCQYQY